MKVYKGQIMLLIICMSTINGWCQSTVDVYGHVYDERTNSVINGVTITQKGSNNKAITDSHGYFIIHKIDTVDSLVFSATDFSERVIPVSQLINPPVRIELTALRRQIEEVEIINTGYQQYKREGTTGSYSFVENAVFNRGTSDNIISRLEGVTSGLSIELPRTLGGPSNNPTLRLRGISTIEGDSHPLIVLDNFPYEGDINSINPNDVERVTLLKDASAASIWGARAGNGVIVITTKGGGSQQQTSMNLSMSSTVGAKPDLYYDTRFLPPHDAVELEKTLFQRGLYQKNDWTSFTPAVEILFAVEEKKIDMQTADRLLDNLKRNDIRKEAGQLLYQLSVNNQYAFDVRGGTDRHHYFLSLGVDKNQENVKGNANNRLTISAKNVFKPINDVTVDFGMNYVKRGATNNGLTLMDLASTDKAGHPAVYTRLVGDDGSALPLAKNNRITYTDQALSMGLLDWHYRPLDEIALSDNSRWGSEVRLNAAIEYNLMADFSITGRYQYQYINNEQRNHHVPESYFSRNLINQFTQQDGTRPIPVGGILIRNSNSFEAQYGRVQIDYNKSWSYVNQISSLVGFEIRHERDNVNGQTRLYGYDDDILTNAANLDFENTFPTRPRSGGRIPPGSLAGNQITDRFVSYFALSNYTYDKKYSLSGSLRWDASNIFGVEFNKKGVPLWSLGAAWNTSDQIFANLHWITMAKLRATYGVNGNVVPSLSSLPYIRFGFTNVASRLPSAQLISVGNPDLSWERVKTVNLGVDLGAFNNRITGTFDWYKKNSENLVGRDFLDPTTGIFPVGSQYNLDNRRNYANLSTDGFDAEVRTFNVNKRLQWRSALLISFVKNKITHYHTPVVPLIEDFFSQYTTPVVLGEPRDQLYSIPWHGLDDTGAPLVRIDNELGVDYNTYFNSLTPDDLIRSGASNPRVFGSFRNIFSWRSLSFDFNLLWKGNYYFRRESIVYNWLFSPQGAMHVDYLQRWKKPGDELITHVPSLPESSNQRRDQAYMFSEVLIEKADHIRLQDMSISYRMPYDLTKKMGLSQLQLFGYARNLGIVWKRTKVEIDPGVKASYPQPLSIAAGIKLQL